MRIISLKQAAEMKFSVVHMFSASGYGDAVMFAAVAREIVRQTGKPMLIATRTVNYEMLAGIDVGLPAEICILDAYYAEILNKANVSKLARHGISLNLFSQTKKKAILSEIAVGMGMTGTQNLTPFLHIDESLDNFGKFTEKPQIAIMSGGIYKKIMPTHICQSIVDKYRDKCDFVLIGMKDDPAISNTVDMRGKLKFPSEVLAVLRESDLFVGSEGGLMHMARAVGTRAVIGDAWLGKVTGYAGHTHVFPRETRSWGERIAGDMNTFDTEDLYNAIDAQLAECGGGGAMPDNVVDLAGIEPLRMEIKRNTIMFNGGAIICYYILSLFHKKFTKLARARIERLKHELQWCFL